MTDRAGRWLRVSTGGQDEGNQEPDIDGWIAARGYEAAETYRLHGKSASKGQQDAELDRAIEDMRHGHIQVLVVWQSSRIERRGAYNAFDLARRVKEASGRIEYVQDAYLNEANDMSDVMLALAATKDHQKSRDISKQVRAAHAAVRRNGGYLGIPPFGYTLAGPRRAKILVPDEAERELVREAFARIAAGQSLGTVGAWLASATGRPWWPSAVAAMIRRPAYRGAVQDAAGKNVAACEAIVSGQEWQAANASLAGRPKRGIHLAEDGSLSGALRCMLCAGPMYRIKGGGGWYYRCVGKGPRRTSGCRNMVRAPDADALTGDVMSTLTRPVIEWQMVKGHNYAAELADIELALADLPRQDLDDDAEDAERARLRSERRRLASLPAVPDQWLPAETGRTYADEWRDLAPAGRRAWLKQYAPRLYAGKAGMQTALMADEDEDSVPGPPDERPTFHMGRGIALVIVWKVQAGQAASATT